MEPSTGQEQAPVLTSHPAFADASAGFRNVCPTPYDELCLCSSIYNDDHILDGVLHSKGFRVFDVRSCADTGLKMATYAVHWFPEPHAVRYFPYDRVLDDEVTVGFVFRGTDAALLRNLRDDLHLVLGKLTGEPGLPLITDKAYCLVATCLAQFNGLADALKSAGKRLRIHVTGHSLGAYLAEVVTVLFHEQVTKQGCKWVCRTFESPGLPSIYVDEALAAAGEHHWKSCMTSYLAAPNPINMLYRHIGRIMHVLVPFQPTVQHALKCVGADMARITALVAVSRSVLAATAAAVSASSAAGAGASAASGLRSVATAGLGFANANFLQQLCVALGVEAVELLDQHLLRHMFGCFDRRPPGDLLPEYGREMAAWPEYGDLHEVTSVSVKSVARWLLPSFVCTENMGIVNALDRQGMVLRRCESMAGYVPQARKEAATAVEAATADQEQDRTQAEVTSVREVVEAARGVPGAARRASHVSRAQHLALN